MPAGTTVSRETIDFLFTVDRYAERIAAGWTQLLAKAVLSGIVLGEAPMGVLTEQKADWLINKIGSDRIASHRSLELVARVVARCEQSPDWLRQLLVELSGRNVRAATEGRDARGLQVMLAETFPQGDAADGTAIPAPAATAKIVVMPAPAATFPIARAA